MGQFKEILAELRDENSKASLEIDELIDASISEEPASLDMSVKEELIFGYMVFYQYSKIVEKKQDGGERVHLYLEILDMTQPLTNKSVKEDIDLSDKIANVLKERVAKVEIG